MVYRTGIAHPLHERAGFDALSSHLGVKPVISPGAPRSSVWGGLGTVAGPPGERVGRSCFGGSRRRRDLLLPSSTAATTTITQA